MNRLSRIIHLLIVFSFVVVADVLTKHLAMIHEWQLSGYSNLYPYGGVGVFQNVFGVDLSFNLVKNYGSAWGLFSTFPFFLLWVRVAIITLIFTYLMIRKVDTLSFFAMALIISGAICNVMDVLRFGYVIDMIHLCLFGWHFPVFNVADVCISLSALFFIIFLPFQNYRSTAAKRNQ